MWYIWLGIVILLSLIEVMTINLATVWFVISGIVALLLSFLINNFVIQFAVFVVLGVFLLIKTKSTLEKWLSKNSAKTNLDRIIGMQGVVTKQIGKNTLGEVKVDGKIWSAISSQKVKINSIVTILEIDGTKLKVEEVK